MLQTQDLRLGQEKESCIKVNTRELNGVLYTKLFTLYTQLLVHAILLLAYLTRLYIILKVNLYKICIILSYSRAFYNITCVM